VSGMEVGDKILVRLYAKIAETATYKRYAEATYEDAQDLPLAYLASKPVKYGFKITAQQTKGTYKTLIYQFFRRRVI